MSNSPFRLLEDRILSRLALQAPLVSQTNPGADPLDDIRGFVSEFMTGLRKFHAADGRSGGPPHPPEPPEAPDPDLRARTGHVIDQFREIRLDGIGSINVTEAPEWTIRVDGLDVIPDFTLRDGVLNLDSGFNSGKIVFTLPTPAYHITTPALEAITIKGAAKATLSGITSMRLRIAIDGAGDIRATDLGVALLTVKIGGAGKLTATGTAELQEIDITGAGSFNGPDLPGRRASVSINGAGKATVNVQDWLTVSIGGVGTVSYHGMPQIEQKVGGLGRVKRA